MSPLIVIIGQTASGKSSCALEIAKKNNGSIVNADSRQLYRELQIGTAKPVFDRVEDGIGYIDDVAHYLYEELSPDERGSVSDYQTRAFAVIDQIHAQGMIPILVGGTGYYVQAVVDNMQYGDVVVDEGLRSDLNELSLDLLQKKLLELDMDVYKKTQFENKRKVIRAIERVMFGQADVVAGSVKYDVLQIGLDVERDVLVERIHGRVDDMIASGLIDEVRGLIDMYGADIPALDSIGYKEVVRFLDGEIDERSLAEDIQIHTRQYAKRQKTWFARDSRICWFEDCTAIERCVNSFLLKLGK